MRCVTSGMFHFIHAPIPVPIQIAFIVTYHVYTVSRHFFHAPLFFPYATRADYLSVRDALDKELSNAGIGVDEKSVLEEVRSAAEAKAAQTQTQSQASAPQLDA